MQGIHENCWKRRSLLTMPASGPNDTFKFGCHPGVSCFNTCCSDVNVFLSPYDVLRLTERLGISSTEFLEKYTLLPVHRDMTTPVVVLRMGEDEAKRCPFLTEDGCGVYTDRPWPCRMYPVGLAASRDTEDGFRGERFYFLLEGGELPGTPGRPGNGPSRSGWTIRRWTPTTSGERPTRNSPSTSSSTTSATSPRPRWRCSSTPPTTFRSSGSSSSGAPSWSGSTWTRTSSTRCRPAMKPFFASDFFGFGSPSSGSPP